MRLALAQINAVVGDLDGNRERILAASRGRARGEAPTSCSSPSSPSPAIRPRTCSCGRPSCAPRRRRCGRSRKACTGLTALVGTPWFDRDLFNACAVCADGEVKGALPQALPAELRRLRRGPLLRARPRAAAAAARRHAGRADDLRGHLAAGPARDRPRPRRCRAARQPLRLAVPRRQGGGPRGDAGDAGARQLRLPRVLQPRRRPGRARLRRPLGRARRRGRGAGARAGLRGGAARRRPRPERGDRPAAARRPPARARARAGGRAGADDRRARGSEWLGATKSRRRDRRRSSRSSSRCGARSCSRSATTSARTASATSCSGSRAGSTRRSSRRSPVDALGPERVHCVSMPSRYSSEGTRSDARRLAESLGCDFREIAIEEIVAAFHEALGGLEGLAAENLQARIRGTMLMALSNTHGWLVLATGNKSELSVGYSTLYGDLAGGFALIKDIYKTDVFRLALHLNERAGARADSGLDHRARAVGRAARRAARRRTRCRPTPSSTRCSRHTSSSTARARSCSRRGSTPDVVDRALALIDRAEYKRRQAPPGVKLRPKAFGRDRRTPITNRWRG